MAPAAWAAIVAGLNETYQTFLNDFLMVQSFKSYAPLPRRDKKTASPESDNLTLLHFAGKTPPEAPMIRRAFDLEII